MIGSFIKGTDQNGKPCEGIVLDKILTIQTIQVPGPPGSLVKNMAPVAIDAYMVLNQDTSSLHMVNPMHVTAVEIETEAPDTDKYPVCCRCGHILHSNAEMKLQICDNCVKFIMHRQ